MASESVGGRIRNVQGLLQDVLKRTGSVETNAIKLRKDIGSICIARRVFHKNRQDILSHSHEKPCKFPRILFPQCRRKSFRQSIRGFLGNERLKIFTPERLSDLIHRIIYIDRITLFPLSIVIKTKRQEHH